MESDGFSKQGSGAKAVKDSAGSQMYTSPSSKNLHVSEYEQITSFHI